MLKVWRWTALAVAAIPGTALAAAAQIPAFQLPNNVAVNVSGGPANPADGSGVRFSASSTEARASASTGTLPTGASPMTSPRRIC